MRSEYEGCCRRKAGRITDVGTDGDGSKRQGVSVLYRSFRTPYDPVANAHTFGDEHEHLLLAVIKLDLGNRGVPGRVVLDIDHNTADGLTNITWVLEFSLVFV
jgi:hypothetical protein